MKILAEVKWLLKYNKLENEKQTNEEIFENELKRLLKENEELRISIEDLKQKNKLLRSQNKKLKEEKK